MNTLNLKRIKKYIETKNSMTYILMRRFFLTIIVPTLFAWFLYLAVLSIYFLNNTISTQQTYLETSVSQLELSLSNANNIFSSLESTPEFINYLDFYSTKSEMLYSLVKNIQSFSDGLCSTNASIEEIKIYSDKPDLLYSPPFTPLSEIPLDDASLQELKSAPSTYVTWQLIPGDYRTIPEIHAYKKLYAHNYSHVLGYMETVLNPTILSDYFEQFLKLASLNDSTVALYDRDRLIYHTDGAGKLLTPAELTSLADASPKLQLFKNSFTNYVLLSDSHLQLVITGSLTDLMKHTQKFPMLLISAIIGLLLLLFIYFFTHITDISGQILDFSEYISSSDPDTPAIYPVPDGKYRQSYEELLHLVKSYNNLIHKNSTLTSRVMVMELLSKNARYQALQAQIHPHFIYGTLENIRMLALQNRDKTAADMIYSLSALIRHSLSITEKAVTLGDELIIAEHYLNIQKNRFGDRLHYHFTIDEALRSLEMPSFVLQPIMENAVIYGISNTFDDCELLIEVSGKDDRHIIKISNTGAPITNERLSEVNRLLSGTDQPADFKSSNNGFALYNIKERLAIFYDNKASLRMSREADFTVVTIIIHRS